MNNILELIENTGKQYKELIAVEDKNTAISYGELLEKAQSIGSYLLSFKKRNMPIPIVADKSAIEIAAFLGIVYSGNFYVPIDEKMPPVRMKLILDVLETSIVISDKEHYSMIKDNFPDKKICLLEDMLKVSANLKELDEVKNRMLDTDPLYALFTSGSTGVPKGVVCCHRSVLNYSDWVVRTFKLDENTIMGNQTPFYFSMSVLDIYSTLRCGGRLSIIPAELFSLPAKLIGYLNERKINTIYWVPSALCMISKFKALDKCKIDYLKTVLFAGEVMPTKQLNYWIKHNPDILYANLFGPTEITDIGIYYIIDRKLDDIEPVPIGKCCDNVGILILDDNMKEVEPGEVGELYFKGTYLALGYYNDWEKTNLTFVQNPLNKYYPEIIYKSGDLVKVNQRNEIEYVSRKDFQIKHMGYRIELGEIENSVSTVEGVNGVCCFLDEERDKIVAVYEGSVDKKFIIEKIKKQVPKYMIPNIYISIPELPLNANGKIDRKKLKNDYIQEKKINGNKGRN